MVHIFVKNLYEVECEAAHERTVRSWRLVKGEELENENLVFVDDDLVDPGVAIKEHADGWDELYYLLSGRGEMRVKAEVQAVKEGDLIHIPKGAPIR